MTNQELNINIHSFVDSEFAKSEVYLKYRSNALWINEIVPDYCNNWNDLIPLTIKHNIQFTLASRDHWDVEDNTIDGFYQEDVHVDDLQRTLSECLLKVLESEK